MAAELLTRDVREAFSSALASVERTGLSTFDSLDISTEPVTQRSLVVRTRGSALLRKIMWAGSTLAPRWNRRCLGVRPAVMHSGVANLASAYLEAAGSENLAKAAKLLALLDASAFRFPEYLGWGFPFPWKQKLLVLAGTPIGHTTMTCANVFLKNAQVTGDQSSLHIVRSACDFFHYGLKHSARKDGAIALSYTPLDQTHIINIQADIGSLLLRFWNLTREERDRTLGLSLLRCVLQTQNSDGSWPYYAPDTVVGGNYIDNHHTGMVLSALAEIHSENLASDTLADGTKQALETGTDYFLERLFLPDGTPKYYHNGLYPIEIYNFAQSIITLLDLKHVLRGDAPRLKRIDELLQRVLRRLLTTMRAKDGAFLFRRTKWARQDLGSLRWANGLTLAALARWLRETEQKDSEASERYSSQSA